MGIDIKRWNRDSERDESNRKSRGGNSDRLEPWAIHDVGRYIGFLVPPQEHMDGLPYVAYYVHKSVPKGPKIICLEHEANLSLFDREDVQALFAERKNFDLKAGSCPIESLNENEPTLLGEMKDGFQYLMLFVPWARLVMDKETRQLVEVPYPEAERVPSWVWAGSQIYSALGEILAQEGDISDMDRGLLVQIHTTKQVPDYYKVSAYKPSGAIKNATSWPFRLPKAQRFAVEKSCGPGKPGDPVAFFARMVKDNQTILDQFKGSRVKEEDVQDAGRPSCFAERAVFNKDDNIDCRPCVVFRDCAAALGIDIEEPKAKPPEPEKPATKTKAAAKVAPKPVSEPPAKAAVDDDDDFANEIESLVGYDDGGSA